MKYYKGSYKYQLAETIHYQTGIVNVGYTLPFCSISSTGLLTIKAGYAWDGPSGPTIDRPCFMTGSLIHDALYQLIRETGFGRNGDSHDIRRHQADQILRNVCIEAGMWEWWADHIVYRGVRAGGGPSAAVKARKVYEAP